MKVHNIIFTMKGCPHCEDIKNKLNENNISFVDRDIHEHASEYDDFSKFTGSDYVPALLIVEEENDDLKSYFYVPEKHYNEINEAVEIVMLHNNKIML
jgi:glutaredoxin